ncbi:MAG: flavodoxin family protein [Oscillospiraceae bacterium]|nr:flavodoxin family protein [Oscillospiraceae bacterium]
MKTLILNGSPRKNGDTVSLIRLLTDSMSGECMTVGCYTADISPCIDCRYCMKNSGCALQDEMQGVYRYIVDCDNFVIASPIYFSELTGRLLDTASRFQTYYCARFFRHEDTGIKPKRGGVILVGGGDGSFEKAHSTAVTLLHQLNVSEIFPLVSSHKTNTLPAAKDELAVSGVLRLALFLSEGR